MRRKPASSAGAGYGRRASQRFSRLLEGVSSLVSLGAGPREEEEEEVTSQALDYGTELKETENSLMPYWVEASRNREREEEAGEETGSGVTDDSGYSGEAGEGGGVTPLDPAATQQQIEQIFASLDRELGAARELELEQESSPETVVAVVERRAGAGSGRRRGVSGYFQDWAAWTLGAGAGEAGAGQGEEQLWAVWDRVLLRHG